MKHTKADEVMEWLRFGDEMDRRLADLTLKRIGQLRAALLEIEHKSRDNWAAARAQRALGHGGVAGLSETE